MSRHRAPDLFLDYEPPQVVDRFAAERMRVAQASQRVARAVAEAMKESRKSRETVASEMSDFLGDAVTVAMLNQYASPSNAGHNIPAHRLIALAHVTGQAARLFNALTADLGLIVLDAKYEPLIRRELAREIADKAERDAAAADAQWRSRR